MDRLVIAVERISGLFLGCVVVLSFVSVLLRDVLSFSIPDWFLFACFLQGIAIFWGVASTTYRNSHIVVDLTWELVGPRGQRAIDLFAALVTLASLLVFAWVLVGKMEETVASGRVTQDLRLPIWPFHVLASLGIGAAALLAAIRVRRLILGR
ncbi:MAG: TRAP transporter small permease [Alphaproteobacteria bacterium]|nr:TRAP transporter small permease [Alphaproteobacteria bacterium]